MSEIVSESGQKCAKMRWEVEKPTDNQLIKGGFCAQEWIRTITSLRTLRPEHSASTNLPAGRQVSPGAQFVFIDFKNPFPTPTLNIFRCSWPPALFDIARQVKFYKACTV